MIVPFFQGFGTSGGLIVAIGAQNAFVLSQSVRGNHHVIVALICIACDAAFISAGIAGFGFFISSNPYFSQWVTWAGALFLVFYGLGSLRSAVRGGRLESDHEEAKSLKATIFTTLAVTLLNPHFYLDTVILLGGISSNYQDRNRLLFWAGAVCASTLWFLCLSLGSRLLSPLFRKQIAWRVLDSLVCATMWTIAVSLFVHGTAK